MGKCRFQDRFATKRESPFRKANLMRQMYEWQGVYADFEPGSELGEWACYAVRKYSVCDDPYLQDVTIAIYNQ